MGKFDVLTKYMPYFDYSEMARKFVADFYSFKDNGIE